MIPCRKHIYYILWFFSREAAHAGWTTLPSFKVIVLICCSLPSGQLNIKIPPSSFFQQRCLHILHIPFATLFRLSSLQYSVNDQNGKELSVIPEFFSFSVFLFISHAPLTILCFSFHLFNPHTVSVLHLSTMVVRFHSFYRPLRVRMRSGLNVLSYTTYASDNAVLNLQRGAGLRLGISFDRTGQGKSLVPTKMMYWCHDRSK